MACLGSGASKRATSMGRPACHADERVWTLGAGLRPSPLEFQIGGISQPPGPRRRSAEHSTGHATTTSRSELASHVVVWLRGAATADSDPP